MTSRVLKIGCAMNRHSDDLSAYALTWRASNEKGPLEERPFRSFGAGNQVRTGDLNLGKVALYQLSYSRRGTRF